MFSKVETFYCKIYVGFREHYSDVMHNMGEAENILHEYCDEVGLCVTITPTKFIYTRDDVSSDGYEDGCEIGLINYPRFPSDPSSILKDAIQIAEEFLKRFNQYRISILTPSGTYMVESE